MIGYTYTDPVALLHILDLDLLGAGGILDRIVGQHQGLRPHRYRPHGDSGNRLG